MMPQWDQRIAFRVIAGGAARRDIELDYPQTAHRACDAVIRHGFSRHFVPRYQAQTADVVRIHQQHHARAVDAPEAVVQPVHGRIELIVTAHGLQAQRLGPGSRHVRILIEALGYDEVGAALSVFH